MLSECITRDKLGSLIPKARTFVEKYITSKYEGRDKSQLEFDKKAAEMIKTDTVLLGVSGLPECAKKAKKLIVFATSAHPLFHQKLLEDNLKLDFLLCVCVCVCGFFFFTNSLFFPFPFLSFSPLTNSAKAACCCCYARAQCTRSC